MCSSKSWHLLSAVWHDKVIFHHGKDSDSLTIDALKEDVEDAVAWYGQFLTVKEAVLDALLIMLIRIEVVVLQVIEEARCDRADALDVIDGAPEFLLAVKYGILQVFESVD